MAAVSLTWHDFKTECTEFLQISERLNDSWSFDTNIDGDGNSFLVYKQKIATFEPTQPRSMLQIEYHIVYSVSYQVPVLYFQAYKCDGSLVSLEDAWKIFRNYDDNTNSRSRSEMLAIITQMEHPVLRVPFLALHPCRTAELLAQTVDSQNRILTFISLMGPHVQLSLTNEYGLNVKE